MDLGEEFDGLQWWLRRAKDKRHGSQWVQQSKPSRRDSAYILALWSRTSPCDSAYWAIYCYKRFYSSNPFLPQLYVAFIVAIHSSLSHNDAGIYNVFFFFLLNLPFDNIHGTFSEKIPFICSTTLFFFFL